jgi:Zn-dependent protease with chaperone function
MLAGGEEDPLAMVIAELRRLAGDAALPVVTLTDRPVSAARAARPWRPAHIRIRREIAAAGPSDTLRGEIAHEYAHVLKPDNLSHFAFSLLAAELGSFGTGMWLTGVIAPWLNHAHRWLWLSSWFIGMILIGSALFCRAWASHRRELRADALAAQLLGDAAPVLAMLEDFQAKYKRLGWIGRLCSLLTHPSPIRRRHELLGTRAESESAHALRETVRRAGA